MSSGLDLCFVKATTALQQAARHVMLQGSCEEDLKEELKQWLAGLSDGGVERQQGSTDYIYFCAEASISFELVVKIHQQLCVNPLGWCGVMYHCLLGSV